MSLHVRLMSRADLDVAIGWAREEGWNPGLDDADAFSAQDPTGFFMGWLHDEPIGCISVVKYGERFAFLGLYIVRSEWRGKGHGKAIWDAGIASAGNRTIGLDGVVAQQDNYKRSGFLLAHRNARGSGVVSASGVPDARVRECTPDMIGAVAALDNACFPEPRPHFLSAWLRPLPTRRTRCFSDSGRVLGYGTIRRSEVGYKIGPLFAQDADIAGALLNALAVTAEGAPISIDIPASNLPAVHLAQRLGLSPTFETARMYRGPVPAIAIEQVFGITTLELG